jgi:hypothetical protein
MNRDRRLIFLSATTAVLALLGAGVAGSARADAANPSVGECFALTDKQSYEEYWPTSAPVPCTAPHSIEIARTGALPADVDAFAFAEGKCDVTSVWAQLGVNRPVGGIVRNPIRIEAFPFAVRGGGSVKPGWLCGVGPVEFRGAKGIVLVSMTGTIDGMTSGQRRSLRYCSSAARGRSAFAKPITVSCSTVPRWQVEKWVMWSVFYSSYPGEAVIAARAAKLCAPATSYSYPTAKDWPDGSRRSFCYLKHS